MFSVVCDLKFFCIFFIFIMGKVCGEIRRVRKVRDLECLVENFYRLD